MRVAAPPASRAPHPFRAAVRLGVAGALLVFGALALLWILALPVFVPADEAAHVDYAVQLTEGRIPWAGDPYRPTFPDQEGQAGRHPQHVSNHPPLYHLVIGPVARAAAAVDATSVLLLIRLLGAVMVGAAVVVLARIAAVVTAGSDARSRALTVVGSAGIAAGFASMVSAAGLIRNDPLFVLLVSLTLLALARATRRPVTSGSVLALGALCTLGMLTRIAFAPVWLAAVAGVLAATLWPDLRLRRPAAADLLRGAARAAVMTALPALGAGWFYLLNKSRYGDYTGGSAVYPLVRQDRRLVPAAEDGVLGYLVHPSSWWTQVKQIVGMASAVSVDERGAYTLLGTALVVVVLLAAAATAYRVVRGDRPIDRHGAVQLLGFCAILAASYVALASHVVHEGAESNRYLIAGIAAWTSGVAVLLLGLGRRFLPYAALALIGIQAFGATYACAGILRRRADVSSDDGWFGVLVSGVEMSGLPAAPVVVAVLLAAVVTGLALQFVAFRRICADDSAPDHYSCRHERADRRAARAA